MLNESRFRVLSAQDLARDPNMTKVRYSHLRYPVSREPYPIVECRNALVIGDHVPVFGFGYKSFFVLFRESSDYPGWTFQWWHFHFKRHKDPLGVVDTLDEACVVTTPWNFGHWLQEGLLKVAAMEMAGYRGKYIIPNNRLFSEGLSLFGIADDRIYSMPLGLVRVERLQVAHPVRLQDAHLYPEAMMEMRRRCLDSADRSVAAKRLYIARKPSSVRSLVNDAQVTRILNSHGFTRLYMEDLSLAQQIGLASSAQVIAGPHGAGMASTIFMQRGGTAIEMFSPAYINTCILPTCRVMNITYNQIVARVNPVNQYLFGERIEVPVDQLQYYIDRLPDDLEAHGGS